MSQQVFSLMSRHQQIDEALRRERKRRLPDVLRMLRLKKMKLILKDRLSALMLQR